MRVGTIPEGPMDVVALAGGLAPTPVIETLLSTMLARTLMTATHLGVFDALDFGPLDAAAVAAKCSTDPRATEKLLRSLAGCGYLTFDGRRYALAPVARKWLLDRSAQPLHDHMELMFLVWRWLEHYEEFVRTGRSFDIHAALSPDEWDKYQRGMRSLAGLLAPEVALRTPVPRGARDMLDIGGSHGLFSVALCKRHRGMRSTILDLPEAVEKAAPLLAAERMGDRVVHRAGNALTEELGVEQYDLVFMAQLVHHFDDAQNRELMRRIARALRPGGVVVVQELVRPADDESPKQAEAIGDLYFAALSASGLWSFDEIASWQRGAGLRTKKPLRFVTYPGAGQQAAAKE